MRVYTCQQNERKKDKIQTCVLILNKRGKFTSYNLTLVYTNL
jgi:hypothetical protein